MRLWIVLTLFLAVADAPSTSAAYETVAVKDGGTINGNVRYVGDVPKPITIPITKDPEVCGREQTAGDLLVSATRGIRNVVVRLQDVARGKPLGKPRTVTLLQRRCEYSPRVTVFPAGSRVRILNEDGILHNTHTRSETNRPISIAQPGFRRVFEQRIEEPEMPIRVRCDVHSWMTAWWISQDHPYYALTDTDGRFSLEDVPAGTYTLEAWHETLGTITRPVTVPPHAVVDVALEMSSPR